MHSFAVLGDVAVHSIGGLNLEGEFTKLPKNRPPRIYEGAAFAGLAIQRALDEVLRLEKQAANDQVGNDPCVRICRYLLPEENFRPRSEFDEPAHPYPFETFPNFGGVTDPMADANFQWTLQAKSLEGVKRRLRLAAETPKAAAPLGVHSATFLESTRPGGMFEYPNAYRSLRKHYFQLRTNVLKFVAIASFRKEPSLKKEVDQNCYTQSVDQLKATLKLVKESISKIDKDDKPPNDTIETLVSSIDDIEELISSVATLFEHKLGGGIDPAVEAKLVDLLKNYVILMQSVAAGCDELTRLPDVLVLFDLFLGSKTNRQQSAHGKAEDNWLRSVDVSHDSLTSAPSVTDDIQSVLWEWISHSFGIISHDSVEAFKGVTGEIKATITDTLAQSVKDTLHDLCIRITSQYAQLMIGKDIEEFVIKMFDGKVHPDNAKQLSADWNKHIDQHHWLPVEPNKVFHAVTRLTIERLLSAEKSLRADQKPRVKPLIVCCLKTLSMPVMPDLREMGGKSKSDTYLSAIYRNRWLRERTVIILDADYLRTLHGFPAGISSESSWEETAFDTVDAFQRRPQLKPYLNFGFIIVRFGVSGALLIAPQPSGELSVRLFFDPEKNDRDWALPDSGEVIGYTSIFASSIVQAMSMRCIQRNSDPVYSDILESLHDGIRYAIIRCQRLCSYGYGSPANDHGAFEEWQKKAFEAHFIHNGILPGLFRPEDEKYEKTLQQEFRGLLNDEQQFAYYRDFEGIVEPAAKWISTSIVPTVRNPRWSIVEQSSASEIEEVAFDIARSGIEAALNKRYITHDDLVTLMKTGAENILNGAGPETVLREELEKELKGVIRKYERSYELTERGDAHKRQTDEVFATVGVREALDRCTEFMRSEKDSTLEKTPEAAKLVLALARAIAEKQLFPLAKTQAMTFYSAPIMRFGKAGDQITALDRREVEGIAAIQRLIKHYAASNFGKEHERPMSIAVFGPPGSGKSTAVKRIAEAQGDKIDFEDLEFNLSQFTEVTQLEDAFKQVELKKGKIPLVFFDEFDSKFGQTEKTDFGWLKYFLAPMEDGRFGEHKVGPAIFVFAGGTSYNFNAFSPKSPSLTDERWIQFSRAKGPDFISRLSGHLNIIGIDPTDPEDGVYLLRRAVLIREFMKKYGVISSDNTAQVDDERVLRAILHAPAYRYGGRSLRMLIEACLGPDKWIRRSNIPALHVLDMMVDSKSFLATLRDSGLGDPSK